MIYEKNSYVAGSMCDGKLKLSVLASDELVENAVTELMGDLGIDGIVAKAKYNAMWLIAKNNICFLRRPDWRERFTVKSYISGHSSVKLSIDTLAVSESSEILLKARTEVCAIDLDSGTLKKTASVGFTDDMEHEPLADGLELSRFPKKGHELAETVTVRSTSLDYCYHTNNVEYVRFVLNTYDVEHFKEHELKQLEVHYSDQSYEKQQLDIEKLTENGKDYFSIRRDGKETTSCMLIWE